MIYCDMGKKTLLQESKESKRVRTEKANDFFFFFLIVSNRATSAS